MLVSKYGEDFHFFCFGFVSLEFMFPSLFFFTVLKYAVCRGSLTFCRQGTLGGQKPSPGLHIEE